MNLSKMSELATSNRSRAVAVWTSVKHLAFELTELFASGDLTPQDMDGIMYEIHKAYFKYREQKREKERIMNL